MFSKISDFKLAEAVLKTLCRSRGAVFSDVPVFFNDESSVTEEGIFVKDSVNVGHTIYKIISQYIELAPKIVGKDLFDSLDDKKDFLINTATIARRVIYKDDSFSNSVEGLTLHGLYQQTPVWILMKDLVCPVFEVNCKNVKIVCGENPFIDIARYCTAEDVPNSDAGYPFIFVNNIENRIMLNAFIFIEAIKAHDLEPIKVLKDIFESDLYDKFRGILKLFFDEDSYVDEFVSILVDLLGIDFWSFLVTKVARGSLDLNKFAQQAQHPDMASQFWYIGLIESMLEPVRGSDWSTHEALDKYRSNFWDAVEVLRSKKGSKQKQPSLTFNELLRLKTEDMMDFKTDTTKTLQGLLSSNRVW